jgi:hypothetical protein
VKRRRRVQGRASEDSSVRQEDYGNRRSDPSASRAVSIPERWVTTGTFGNTTEHSWDTTAPRGIAVAALRIIPRARGIIPR